MPTLQELTAQVEELRRLRAEDATRRDADAIKRTRARGERDEWVARFNALLGAVAEHHGQKADDRCIEDDDRLYEAAGFPPCDRRVGDKAAMLANCARFIERRCEGGGWATYAELEALLRRVKVRVSYVGMPQEPRREDGIPDWRLLIRAIEAALLPAELPAKIRDHVFIPCYKMAGGCERRDRCHHVDPHRAAACGALGAEHVR